MKEKYIKYKIDFNEYKTVDIISISGKIRLDDEGWIDKWY